MGGFVPIIHGRAANRPDEDDTLANAGDVAHALESLGYGSEIIEIDFDLTALETLAARGPLAVFNLMEGIRGDGALGHFAAAVLDHLKVPYTGAKTAAYLQSASKLMTKHLLRAKGLPHPDYWIADTPPKTAGRVIVKSVDEHASYGIDQKSVVEAEAALPEIARREAAFGGRFFAEEYIEGREFNISVLETEKGPQVLPIAEMAFDDLPEGTLPIIDYAAKWDEEAPSYSLMRRRFSLESEEPVLAVRLREITLDCWRLAGLSGYARVDFRVDRASAPFILEVNANPSLARDAGFAAALTQAGFSYEEGIGEIVAAALRGRVG